MADRDLRQTLSFENLKKRAQELFQPIQQGFQEGAGRVQQAFREDPGQFFPLSKTSLQQGVQASEFLQQRPERTVQFAGNVGRNIIRTGQEAFKGFGEAQQAAKNREFGRAGVKYLDEWWSITGHNYYTVSSS